MTGPELLRKSIEYHDPNGLWPMFKGAMTLTETRPNGADRSSTLLLDNSKNFFRIDQTRAGRTIKRVVENGECHHSVEGQEPSDSLVEKFKLTCERTKLLQNYYTYLWGLPMKLTDPGTIVHEEVQSTDFQGTPCLSIKVDYADGVGDDTWYFYFEPVSHALVGYRFYHDESKNDGEYILLKGEAKVGEMRLPKRREWYENGTGKFLGADILE